MNQSKRYEIALSLIPGLKFQFAKKLIELSGSAEAIFKDKHIHLLEGIKENIKREIQNPDYLEKADSEVEKCMKYNIETHFFTDPSYPYRLLECKDAPIVFYSIGKTDYNSDKIISIIGTRSPSPQGIELTIKLVENLYAYYPETVIVSGLAYGIDITAHSTAVNKKMNNVAVMAHGMHQIYPPLHRNTALNIIENGSLITEFTYGTDALNWNFLKRNRIIAGISDATIVIESGIKGGSMTTAKCALSYNRELFAYPGRATDKWYEGCNCLIKSNKAAMIESAEDLIRGMNWDLREENKNVQLQIFESLSPIQKKIYSSMPAFEEICIGEISRTTGYSISQILSDLTELELCGMIKALPGACFLKLQTKE